MTEYTDEQLTSLISRHLDGDLTASEQAELDRIVLADPSAGRVLEEYRRLDAQAAAALNEAFGSPGAGWVPVGASAGRARGWLGPVSAAAAALLLAAGVWMAVRYWPGSAPEPPDRAGPVKPIVVAAGTAAPAGDAIKGPADAAGGEGVPLMSDVPDPSPMFDGAQRGDRFIDRQFFGGFDEAGREYYLMELDRVRTRVETISLDM